MSFLSRFSLTGAVLITGGIILYVHYSQSAERDRLRSGVMREFEARASNANRKAENLYILNQQKELEKYLRKEQPEVEAD